MEDVKSSRSKETENYCVKCDKRFSSEKDLEGYMKPAINMTALFMKIVSQMESFYIFILGFVKKRTHFSK